MSGLNRCADIYVVTESNYILRPQMYDESSMSTGG